MALPDFPPCPCCGLPFRPPTALPSRADKARAVGAVLARTPKTVRITPGIARMIRAQRDSAPPRDLDREPANTPDSGRSAS